MRDSDIPTRSIDLLLSRRSDNGGLAGISRFDWQSSGLPPFHEWPAALNMAARLVAHASVPMALMVGPEGRLVPNTAANALFGEFTNGDLLARPVGEVVGERANFYSRVLSHVFTGESCSFHDQPMRLVRNGQWATRWFNLLFTPVADARGQVLAVLGIASEVTSHVRRARKLRESEQRLKLALESSGMVGIWDYDVKTNISTSDANVARMYGLSAAGCARGVDDGNFIRAIHSGDRARVEETLFTAVETRTSYRCKYRVLPQGGALRWVITSAKPVYDERGDLVRMSGVVVDVTDQMETASALAQSRFQFETLTEALPQIVWSCDAEGRYDYFSARWSEFTGILSHQVSEDTWKMLIDPAHWDMVRKKWGDAIATGTPYDVDYRFRHHSGEYRWLRVMALPIRDDEGNITRWFGTSTDIHDSYLAAEERARLTKELERMATEDQLTEVLTRRAFISRASTAIEQASKHAAPISLLMMDLDHFKSINDAHGHPCGDQVLAVAAKRIKACIKKQDLVGRMGGEEFAVLLNGCGAREAKAVADRICRALEAMPIAMENGLSVAVTVSVGATTRSAPDDDLASLLLVADKALYQAKATGRNRSVFHQSLSASG